ncbi:MAG TPA: glycosyltransferase [Candidatus Woesebacteria bacterium]|nr:glycosyltransferase [Candidatus Woesebacteria bacterium]
MSIFFRKIKNFIDKNSLGENIKILGFVDNPYPYLKAADCLICSSYAEGFSTAIAESIILGLPVISTDCAGVAEAFGDESCGIICDNTDDALKDAIKDVLENPSFLGDFKLACQNRADFFSLKANIAKIEKLLLESVSK